MHGVPEAIRALVHTLMKLPGVGERTAEELVYRLLEDRSLQDELFRHLTALRDLRTCELCGGYTRESPCPICQDPSREPLLMVVPHPKDVWIFERIGFRGRYHVLGGLLDPLQGVNAEDLRTEALRARLQQEPYREVILALGGTFEAHTTVHFLQEWAEEVGLKVPMTRLGTGVPMGKRLESLDLDTLREAFVNRQPVR